MRLLYCLLAFLCFWPADTKSVFNGVEQDNKLPRLLNAEDPRTDGISYEINRALVAEHLKATSHRCTLEGPHGNTLEDMMKPGVRHIPLSYWDNWTCRRADNFLRILNDTNLSSDSTWHIEALGGWAYQGNMTLLADVIRTLPSIVAFHWKTERLIPAIILESLQTHHPTCRLYYTIPMSKFGDDKISEDLPYNIDGSRTEQNMLRIMETRQILEATTPQSILRSKNLYSLTAHIDHGHFGGSMKLDLVHQILLTCPDVRELDLRIARCPSSDRSSPPCNNPIKKATTFGFDFTKHEGTLPPLEVLRLEGYRFDYAVDGTHVDPEVNMPLEMANLNVWLTSMDWSRLHSLHLSDPLTQTLKRLFADTLPKLRHFRIDGGLIGHVRAPVLKYLAEIPSLESLAMEEAELRPLDSLLDVIETHHSTLRSLKLNHQSDGPAAAGDRFWANDFQYATATFLSSAQLTRLFEICPNLQSLDLDIQTSSGWNYEILDTLLSFPQLRELTLRFPPETGGQHFRGSHLQNQHQSELMIAMKGLRNYLTAKKEGEPFDVLKTFIGWKEFGDEEVAERGPSWML